MARLHSSAPLPDDLTDDYLADLAAELEEALRTEGPEVIFELPKDQIVNIYGSAGIAVGWLVRDKIYVREGVNRHLGSIIEVAVLGQGEDTMRATVLSRKSVVFQAEAYVELCIHQGVAAVLVEKGV